MENLKMHTPDLATENYKKLVALFPNAVTETITGYDDNGKAIVERAIDADVLRQEIAAQVVEGAQERYQFTWPDKKRSVVLANQPIAKTLRLVREKSVGKDGTPGSIDTENIYIEGDNLDALKLLQETYLGKVKMIYIDPPYNTGSDFIYEDDFSQDSSEYIAGSGQLDDDGNRLVQNLEGNGRFHTDWLNMLYPRLRIAKDFLSDDGAIFISIDDNEIRNLRIICDEIFGAGNFVSTIVWQKIHSTKNDARYFSENHEYALVYAKSIEHFSLHLLPRTDDMNSRYKNPDNDPRGPWQSGDLVASGERSNGHFIITSPLSGKEFDVPQGKHWVYSEVNLRALVEDNQIWFGADGNSFPRKKRFLSDVQDGRTPNTMWLSEEVGHNQTATREVKAIFDDEKVFDFPKPVSYIKQMLIVGSSKDALIMDFFSGSGTTAHAIMQQNVDDGGNRKFIMVQLPEETGSDSGAFKAGYETICDIGEERIRRAGKKIREELAAKQPPAQTPLQDDHFALRITNSALDFGFRVFRVDSSNMKDVYYRPNDFQHGQLSLLADNIKEDRTPEDLLFQIMLDLGVLLSSKIEETTIDGKKVFSVADGYLIACFDKDVTDETVKAIAKQHPFYAVFRDAGIASDSVMTNFEQIFETYSPKTQRKVL